MLTAAGNFQVDTTVMDWVLGQVEKTTFFNSQKKTKIMEQRKLWSTSKARIHLAENLLYNISNHNSMNTKA